jgi:hypothetical protein
LKFNYTKFKSLISYELILYNTEFGNMALKEGTEEIHNENNTELLGELSTYYQA